jgi:hypothetical protein
MSDTRDRDDGPRYRHRHDDRDALAVIKSSLMIVAWTMGILGALAGAGAFFVGAWTAPQQQTLAIHEQRLKKLETDNDGQWRRINKLEAEKADKGAPPQPAYLWGGKQKSWKELVFGTK